RGFLSTFALPAQQFVDAGLHLRRAVDMEDDIGNMAHAHTLMQLVPDVAAGGHESLQGVCFLFFFAIDGYVNLRRFSARIEHDLRDIGEADARVGKLPFDHDADLLAQRLGNAVSMMLTCPGFHHLIFLGLNYRGYQKGWPSRPLRFVPSLI